MQLEIKVSLFGRMYDGLQAATEKIELLYLIGGGNATWRKCHTEKMPTDKMPHIENSTWNKGKRDRMENETNSNWKVCDMQII